MDPTPPPIPSGASPPPKKPAKFAQFILWVGFLFPVYTIGYELTTRACSGTFFDPIPSKLHVVAAALVPLTCFLTWLWSRNPSERNIKLLGILNRAAWPVVAVYAVAFAWLSLIAAMIFIPSFQEPVLLLCTVACLGPMIALVGLIVATVRLKSLRSRVLPEAEAVLARRQGRWGWAVGLVLLFVAEAPLIWTQQWLGAADSSEASVSVYGVPALRIFADQDLMLRKCYDQGDSDAYGPTLAILTSVGRPLVEPFTDLTHRLSPDRAREIFYQVTGTTFNELKPPRAHQTAITGLGGAENQDRSLDDMVWDEERGGTAVGARIRGLFMATSAMEWQLNAASAQAYGEWTVEFSNRHANAQEARCQVLLPPGGVVSRVSLWINDEPREAAFGAKANVVAAYQQVVQVEQRDPLLVTMCGPDRVAVQCFPVPPGGIMKIRLGITVPCDARTQGKLMLPVIVERNFSFADGMKHQVTWMTDQGGKETQAIADASLYTTRLASLSAPALVVWTEDPFAKGAANVPAEPPYVIRHQETLSPKAPQYLVVVLDGSVKLRPHLAELKAALEALPSNLSMTFVVATDGAPAEYPRQDLAKALAKGNFTGGRDNLPAIHHALELAAAMQKQGQAPAILWLHGPQPWTFGLETAPQIRSEESVPIAKPVVTRVTRKFELLKSAIADFSAPPTIHTVEVVAGPNRTLEALYQLADLRSGHRWDGTSEDLKSELLSAAQGGDAWGYRFARSETVPTEGQKVWDHLARQLVYEEVLGAFKGTDISPEALARKAALHQLVTPYSGAVVLETKQQYDRAGLEAVDPSATPKIPNMVPEPSRALLLLLGLSAMLLRRRRSGGSGA